MSLQDQRTVSIMRRAIEGMFPQFAVNRLFPRQPLKVGRGTREKTLYPFRWLHRPLTLEQARWVASRSVDYWFRWLIAFGASLYLCQIGTALRSIPPLRFYATCCMDINRCGRGCRAE